MIPLAVPNLAGRESEYLQECINSTYVSSVGPFVSRFEEMVAQAAGAKHAVATSAGTTALHVALLAVGVSRDDLVIAPSFTFVASVAAIAHCGASPWLFDIVEDGWTIDVAMVKSCLEAETARAEDGQLIHCPTGRRVAAILPVFTLGIPADMSALVRIAQQYRLPIIADAAAALGAVYKGQTSGNLGADFTVYSFNGNKTVTAGGGGVAVSNDEDRAKLLRHLSTTARVGSDYDHDMVGYNYRMTNLQAAIGCAQMENLEVFLTAKRRISDRYNKGLCTISGVSAFPTPNYAKSACWFSGVVLAGHSRHQLDDLRVRLRQRGIEARSFWKPSHHQSPYSNSPKTQMSVTERIWPHILTLPCSTSLSDADQRYIIDCVKLELADV